jgi:hypothetical protein
MNEAMERCIQHCQECERVCLDTLMNTCLPMGGRHVEQGHVRLMLDCAEICGTSANFMIRGSSLHTRTCAVCAEVCEQCAQDCSQFGDDARMQKCAEVCRLCATSCRQMAGMAGREKEMHHAA